MVKFGISPIRYTHALEVRIIQSAPLVIAKRNHLVLGIPAIPTYLNPFLFFQSFKEARSCTGEIMCLHCLAPLLWLVVTM